MQTTNINNNLSITLVQQSWFKFDDHYDSNDDDEKNNIVNMDKCTDFYLNLARTASKWKVTVISLMINTKALSQNLTQCWRKNN